MLNQCSALTHNAFAVVHAGLVTFSNVFMFPADQLFAVGFVC
jgi:hypothetical protein